MIRDIILNKLNQLHYKYSKTGKEFILTNCLNPKHNDSKPSMWINLNTGAGQCFTCQYRVNRDFWLSGIEDDLIDEIQRETLYKEIEKQLRKQEAKKEVFILPPNTDKLPAGWRALTQETIDKYGLYLCNRGKYRNRVIFPFYNYDNELVGFNTRKYKEIDDGKPKYLYSTGINIKNLIYPLVEKNTTELIIVEGIMDALSLTQDGFNAIANFGVGVHFTQEKVNELLKRGVSKLWIMFDTDQAGIEAASKIKYSFLQDYFELDYAYKNKDLKPFYKSGFKDYNDYLVNKKTKSS